MSIERYNEVKTILTDQIRSINNVIIEDTKLSNFINVMAYHYCLIEGKLTHLYNNQFLDSVNNESDLLSICQTLGVTRRSMVPNSVYISLTSNSRGQTVTASKNGISYNFVALKTGSNTFYEGNIRSWSITVPSETLKTTLTDSDRLYLGNDSLLVQLNGSLLRLADNFEDFGNAECYHISEDSIGRYSIEVYQAGTLSVSGLRVGSKESGGIKTFASGGTNYTSARPSTGYQEKESIEETQRSIPALLLSNNRAVTLSDYNIISSRVLPALNVYFYEGDINGVLYFSNKGEFELNDAEVTEVIETFQNSYSIPGIELRYKRIPPVIWEIAIECVVTNLTYESVVRNAITTYFSALNNKLSLYEFMLYMFDQYRPNLLDIKINSSIIKIPVNNEKIVKLNNIQGNISLRPYIDHVKFEDKIIFVKPYTGTIKAANILSPVSFIDNEYVSYQYSVKFSV